MALNKLSKTTLLFTNTLRVEFGDEGEHEYMLVVGTAALLVAYERSVVNAKYVSDTLSPLEGDELLSHSNGLACPQRELLCEQWLIRWLAQTTSIR